MPNKSVAQNEVNANVASELAAACLFELSEFNLDAIKSKNGTRLDYLSPKHNVRIYKGLKRLPW